MVEPKRTLMEPREQYMARKRQATAPLHSSRTTDTTKIVTGLYSHLPEVVDTKIASFLTLSELQTLRGVHSLWKSGCLRQMEARVLHALEQAEDGAVQLEVLQQSSQSQTFSFHLSWPEALRDKEALIQSALHYVGVDVCHTMAARFLRRRGWVTIMDFVDNHVGGDFYDMGETGWGVRIQFIEQLSKQQAWKLLAQNVRKAQGDDDLPAQGLNPEALQSAQQYIFALFASASIHRLWYAKFQYRHPHPDSPSGGGQEDALFFETSTGRSVSIGCQSFYFTLITTHPGCILFCHANKPWPKAPGFCDGSAKTN